MPLNLPGFFSFNDLEKLGIILWILEPLPISSNTWGMGSMGPLGPSLFGHPLEATVKGAIVSPGAWWEDPNLCVLRSFLPFDLRSCW